MISTGMIYLKFYLTYSGTTTTLQNSPDGWDEQLVKWERSMEFLGLFREFTIPLKFVKDGAKILRTAYYTDGAEAEVTLTIEKRNHATGAFEEKYSGVIDFATFSDYKDYVEVTAVDSGAAAIFKNQKDTEIQIPIGTTTQLQFWPPTANYETVKAGNIDQHYLGFQAAGSSVDGPLERIYYYPVQNFLNIYQYYVKPVYMGDNNWLNLTNNNPIFHDANKELLSYVSWISIGNCKINLRLRCDQFQVWVRQATNVPDTTCNFKIQVVLHPAIGAETILIDNIGYNTFVTHFADWRQNTSTTGEYVLNDIEMASGDSIYIQLRVECFPDPGNPDTYFDLAFDAFDSVIIAEAAVFARMPITNLPFKTAADVFSYLVDRMSAGTIAAKSDYLDSCGLLLTSGDGARNLDLALIKTSMADFFKFLWGYDEVGIGCEIINGVETIVLEELEHFMDESTESLDIGSNIANLNAVVAADLILSRINVGPPDGTYDDYFGKEEYNQREQWILPIKKITKEGDWTMPYHTDHFSLLWTIREGRIARLDGVITPETLDTEGDNLVYVVDATFYFTSGGVDYYLANQAYTITGVSYPTQVINVGLTPKRCLMRHNSYLRSVLLPDVTSEIKFRNGVRNTSVVTSPTSPVSLLDEDADFAISTLSGDPLFYPLYFIFDTPVYFSYTEVNKYGYVKFEWLGNEYTGFIIDVSAPLAKNKPGTIKLLALATNDLTPLIR